MVRGGGGGGGEEDVNGQRLAGVARGAQHRPLLLTLQVKIHWMIVLVVQLCFRFCCHEHWDFKIVFSLLPHFMVHDVKI